MFSLKILVVLFLCHKATSSHDILLPRTVEDSCLSTVLGQITKDDEVLAIDSSSLHHVDDTLKDGMWELFGEKMKLILNHNGKLETANNRTFGTVLLLASSKGDIVEGISSLRGANAWNLMTKFIILYLDRSGHGITMLSDQFVKDVFHMFVSLNAWNVHFIYEFGNEFTLFSYKDTTCGEVEPIGEECALHNILRANKFESECTIEAAVSSHEPYSKDMEFAKGVEIRLVKELARWAHLDIELKTVDYHELKDKSFDIIVGASNQMKDKLTQTIDFDFDELTWCVKKADLYPTWLTLFMIATWDVWMVCAIGVYITAATLYAFFYYYHHPQNYHYCAGITALCMFSIPVPYYPTHGIARIHFGIMLIYGLLAVILINSFLISVMTKPKHQYQIKTVDELMYHNYKILIDEEILSLHQLGDDEVSTYTKQNYERCNGVILCLGKLLEQSNVAAIVARKFAEHFESTLSSSIFCFASSEAFNKATRALTLSRSNYLLNKTNWFIRQAMETGHLLKWESVSARRKSNEDNWNGPLTVEHFTGVLMAYAIVMIVAVLTFIGEWLTFKNIQKGDAAGAGWKFLDKYIFSPERLIRNSSSTLEIKSM